MVKPFIMGSDSAKDFLQIGIKILHVKGIALDAVEQTCRAVESNPADHGVGLGGIPNLAGDVTLDASIMCGRTLNDGAVGYVRNYLHVITLARRVMEESPHVLLVGDGAELFAEHFGFEKTKLLTPYAEEFYKAFKENDSTYWVQNLTKIRDTCGPTSRIMISTSGLSDWSPT